MLCSVQHKPTFSHLTTCSQLSFPIYSSLLSSSALNCQTHLHTISDKLKGGCEMGTEDGVVENLEKKTSTVDAEELRAEKLAAVLSVNLVFERILSHLSFDDMKSVSEVSREFLQLVRSSKRFNEKVVYVVKANPHAERYGRLFRIRPPHKNWRSIRFSVKMHSFAWSYVIGIIQNAEFISFTSTSTNKRRQFFEKDANGLIYNVLRWTPKLTTLQIDARCLQEISFAKAFSTADVRETLNNLRNLEIVDFDGSHVVLKESSRPDVSYLSCLKLSHLEANFEALARTPMKLSSFRMNRASFCGEQTVGFMKHIPGILRNNRETLEELSVHLSAWSVEGLCEVRLSGLRKLRVTVNPEDQENLAGFLGNHPLLEEFELQGKEVGRQLWQAIKRRCSRLRKFHLNVKRFSGFGGRDIDWTFLGEMERLKDFQIARSSNPKSDCDRLATGIHLVSSLPKNQLESLSFKGISRLGFWRGSDGLEPELKTKTDLLGKFRSVRRLSFRGCRDAVDDKVMQFILREFLQLEELEVSHCDKLSDAGISGNDRVSLLNLKALRSLRIDNNRLVSPKGLLACLTLPNLKSLHFSTETVVSWSFVRRLGEKVPSLESICVDLPPAKVRSSKTLTKANGRKTIVSNLRATWFNGDEDSDEEDFENVFWDEHQRRVLQVT